MEESYQEDIKDMTANIVYTDKDKTLIADRRISDVWGSGYFGAGRNYYKDGELVLRKHNGVDFLVTPFSEVYSTVTGAVTKLGTCYRGDDFRYVQVDDVKGNHVRHFYILPTVEVSDRVEMGMVIGLAQDLAQRYPADEKHPEDMPNHVHLEIVKEGTLYGTKEFINPDGYVFA